MAMSTTLIRWGLVVVVVGYATVIVAEANSRGGFWGWGSHNYTGGWWGQHHRPNATRGPRKIVVGGSEGWHYGFNYFDWAFKNAPFYISDVLVFKYDPPAPFQHSVYLLPDLWSYLTCDLSRAKMVANVTEGRGDGFEFSLNQWRPHYFACGEQGGVHCDKGMMRFFVFPMFGPWN